MHARWLIARGNVFAPSALAVGKLVDALRAANFLPDPRSADFGKLAHESAREIFAKETGAYAVHTVENTFGGDTKAIVKATTESVPLELTKDWLDDGDREELRLVWPVSDASLLKAPVRAVPGRYAIELHRALEYVYPQAKGIEPLDATCKCGEDLSFEWDEDEVVPAFRSATGIFAECDECSRTFDPAKTTAEIAGEEVAGGAAYRFALVVTADTPVGSFDPELVALLEKEFGRSFYEVAG